MHPSSLDNMREALNHMGASSFSGTLEKPTEVLDVGGRNNSEHQRSYIDVLQADATESNYIYDYSVADIVPGQNVDRVMLEPYRIPWGGDVFDIVVSGQTLEHVPEPYRLIGDMVRVLRPGGYIVLIAPSAGPWHGEADYWRFGRDAFKPLPSMFDIEAVADWIYTGDSGGGRGRLWDDHVFVGRKR